MAEFTLVMPNKVLRFRTDHTQRFVGVLGDSMGSPVLGAGVGRKGVPVPVVNPDRLQPCPDHLLDFTIVLMGPRHGSR